MSVLYSQDIFALSFIISIFHYFLFKGATGTAKKSCILNICHIQNLHCMPIIFYNHIVLIIIHHTCQYEACAILYYHLAMSGTYAIRGGTYPTDTFYIPTEK